MPRKSTLPLIRRIAVIERDGGACRFCGTTDELHVHHMDGRGSTVDNPNHDPSNLVTLCQPCHVRVHSEKITLTHEFLARVERIRRGAEPVPALPPDGQEPVLRGKFMRPHNAFLLAHPEEAED